MAKALLRIGNYSFIKKGRDRGSVREILKDTMLPSHRFVPMAEADALVSKHGRELRRNGCKVLLGAHGERMWWRDMQANTATESDWELDDQLKYPGQWFVLAHLRKPFQVVRVQVGGKKFSFAVVRSGDGVLGKAGAILRDLEDAGLEPSARKLWEFTQAVEINKQAEKAYHVLLEKKVGPLWFITGFNEASLELYRGEVPIANYTAGEEERIAVSSFGLSIQESTPSCILVALEN